jgi:leader peptidase (prepilin peptidase)/N-methyltransferase
VAIFAFLIGASIGSFLNVVIDRVPEGRSLVHPPSSCDSCHTRLRTLDLVPVLSYLALRGKCRYCGASIPFRVPFIEAAMGSLTTGLYIQHGLSLELFVLGGAVAYLLVIAGIDFERQLILNSMTVPALVVTLALAAFWPDLDFPRTFFGEVGRLDSFLNSLISGAGAFTGFILILILSRGGMGEGDVKLAPVLGFFLGYPAVVVALWLAAISGGIVAIILWVMKKKGRKDALPYGVFLAGGAIAAIMMLDWITTRYLEEGLQAFTL